MATKQSSRKSSSRKTSSRSSAGGGSRKSSSRRSGDEDQRRSGSDSAGSGRRSASSGSRSAKGGGGDAGSGARKSASKGQSRASGGGGKSSKGGGEGKAGGSRSGARSGGTRAESGGRGRKSSGRGGRMDALKLLKEDHDRVDDMFKKYERMKEGDERKQALLQQILEEVRVHAQVEEELFYPALRTLFEESEKDKEVGLIEEADVEHETVKWLMEQLESGDQSDEGTTDARVKVMGEYIRHHVEEEEGQIFKAAKRVDLDLEELGRQMDARKRQLMGEDPAGGEGGGDTGMQINEPAQLASGRTTH